MNNQKLKDAVMKWVGEFNSLPQSLIKKAYHDFDGIDELTPDDYYCGDCCHEWMGGNEFPDECPNCGSVEVEERQREWLPMWGTMWSFDNSSDEAWARYNITLMAELGFRVYESDDLGVFFGIDGAGFDFYTERWIPLYLARGLKWHEK